MTARLALGTAQFDGVYGRDGDGVAPAGVAGSLLCAAERLGIDMLDTAAGYAGSEASIGAHAWTGAAPRVVTKSPHPGSTPPEDWDRFFHDAITESLRRLNASSVHAFLCHSPALFSGDRETARAVAKALDIIREAGLSEKVGISVYTRADIDAVLSIWRPDLIQLPLSFVDQRLTRDGTLDRLASDGIEVHARSLFLRGTLLRPHEDLPAHLAPLAAPLRTVDGGETVSTVNRLRACLGFATRLPGVTRLVVGAEDARQLEDLSRVAKDAPPSLDWDALAVDDPTVLNPGLWPASP